MTNVIKKAKTQTHLSLLHLLPRSQSSAVCYSPTHTRGRCLCPCTGSGECYSTVMSLPPARPHQVSSLSAPAGGGKAYFGFCAAVKCILDFLSYSVCMYLKFSAVILCLYSSKHNSTAADECQLISSEWTERGIMQWDRYLNGTEQLKRSCAPQRHHRLPKIT